MPWALYMHFLLFVCLWPCWLFVAALKLSLVAASKGRCLDVIHRLLTAVVSLNVERGLWGAWAQQLQLVL